MDCMFKKPRDFTEKEKDKISEDAKRQLLCLKLFLLITIISHVTMSRHLEKTHGTIQNNNALRFL